MYSKVIVLLSVLTLKNVNGFNPNRHTMSSLKNSNSDNQEQVIPARYKIKSNKPYFDPTIAENIHGDNFPEVEYPSSIMDSAKPFYMNVSPFSNDVKTSFKSLVSGGTAKATPTIVLNLKSSENKKDNIKSPTSIKDIDNDNNLKPKETNETFKEPLILDSKNETGRAESGVQTFDLSSEEEELEYVIGFIDDLDEFITTLTDIETEIIDINNSTMKTFDTKPIEEFSTITSDVKSGSNESSIELNEASLHTDSIPGLGKSNDSSPTVTSLVTEDTTPNAINESQSDLADTELIADDNSS